MLLSEVMNKLFAYRAIRLDFSTEDGGPIAVSGATTLECYDKIRSHYNGEMPEVEWVPGFIIGTQYALEHKLLFSKRFVAYEEAYKMIKEAFGEEEVPITYEEFGKVLW